VFAAAKIQTKLFVNGELKRTTEEEMTLEETGNDAKSQLPDSN
jgi:hypothetical protein